MGNQGIVRFVARLWVIFASSLAIGAVNERLAETYSWNCVDFAFPDSRTRQQLIQTREFVPCRNVPLGTAIWRDRFFMTYPRWLTGIAATLTYFRISDNQRSPVMIPYPDYETNHLVNGGSYQNKIVSVFRLNVDVCNRLWFVDTGLVDLIGENRQVIAPRLFVYDLLTDTLVRRYNFPTSDVSEGTIFGGNIQVDVNENDCSRAFAYIPDFGGYRLVVYSYEQDSSWRIKHPYFYFDPFASAFNIGGLPFLWTDGIFGTALSAPRPSDGNFKLLYFTGISSNYQFAVSTRYLRDRSIATNTSTLLNEYRVLGTRGPGMQTTSHIVDERSGILFFTLVNRNGVGCWNTISRANDFSPNSIQVLATDDVTMIFPNDVIIDDARNLWLLSDRLPVSNVRGLTADQVNFRLFRAPIDQLVRGTLCESSANQLNANSASSSGSSAGNLFCGNFMHAGLGNTGPHLFPNDTSRRSGFCGPEPVSNSQGTGFGSQGIGSGNSGNQGTGFGNSGGQGTSFGNSANQGTGLGNSGSQGTSFGNSGSQGTSFGNSGNQLTGFGNSGSQGTSFGNSGNQGPGFGNSGSQGTSFGNSGNQGTGFGNSGNQGTGFGNSGSQGTSFGNSGNQGTGFGNSGGQGTGFGSQNTATQGNQGSGQNSGFGNNWGSRPSGNVRPNRNKTPKRPVYTRSGIGNTTEEEETEI